MNHSSSTIRNTPIRPVQAPALKMVPMASQLLNENVNSTRRKNRGRRRVFIVARGERVYKRLLTVGSVFKHTLAQAKRLA
jgi:hypothetical protein